MTIRSAAGCVEGRTNPLARMTGDAPNPVPDDARAPSDGRDGPSRAAWIVSLVAFQAAWFAAVLGAAHRRPVLGTACVAAAVAAHVALARRPREELGFVLAVAGGGFLVESVV